MVSVGTPGLMSETSKMSKSRGDVLGSDSDEMAENSIVANVSFKQRQPTANISEDRNQARRERDRARRNSLTAEEKKENNARRRASGKSTEENERQRACWRAKRNSLTAEEKDEINAQRRASRQNKALDERNAHKGLAGKIYPQNKEWHC